MERVGSVRVELEVEVWVVCDPCERKQEERYSCVYIYIYEKTKIGSRSRRDGMSSSVVVRVNKRHGQEEIAYKLFSN